MDLSPFHEMQKAVDVVNTSPHPTNKIAATVFGCDVDGASFSVSYTNYWPEEIVRHFGYETRIGNSSGTVHAETACLLRAPYTEGASLCITDPFCPNCAKNMAESGIKTIFIDHKGFDKDFAARRHHHFQSMSMQICEKAGISVYEIWRKEERLVPILEIPQGYVPVDENPVRIGEVMTADLKTLKKLAGDSGRNANCAIALAEDRDGQAYSISAAAHPAVGYSLTADRPVISEPQGKYSFMQEPANRILMNARRHGLHILGNYLFLSQVPTAREQVNLVGAGVRRLYISDNGKARDEHALAAMTVLQKAGILEFKQF